MGKKRFKKARKSAINQVKLSLVTGVGATAISGVGGNAAGITSFSRGFPAVGSIEGAKLTLGSLKDIKPKKKKARSFF